MIDIQFKIFFTLLHRDCEGYSTRKWRRLFFFKSLKKQQILGI